MIRPFPSLRQPIVQAPLAGGPSTPELAAAVSAAGGLGFLAAGYKDATALAADIERLRTLAGDPFGVNLFWLAETPVDAVAVARYTRGLGAETTRYGAEAGDPHFDDDDAHGKLDLLIEKGVAIVSFTFGCPPGPVVDRLHGAGASAWVTVTTPDEAASAEAAGADALVVQGAEAGGHRGSFVDDAASDLGLIPLLRLVRRVSSLPMVGSGGIADGAGIAAVLAAGAVAAQIGTAFLRTPEAATSAPHRAALSAPGRTAVTRAFTGRRARGIVNRFLLEHDAEAPAAYPHIHHATAPIRAAARIQGDGGGLNLWAGEAFQLAEEAPAGDLVARWGAEARAALTAALDRAGSAPG